MTIEMTRLSGVVARGHRVASGLCGDVRFPAGTIAPQLPFFRSAIADFEGWLGGEAWPATINVALTGLSASPGIADIAVGPVHWTEHFPPERFLMSRCRLVHHQVEHRVWLYIPDPATKPDHFQPSNLVEVLAQRLAGLAYDDPADVMVPSQALVLSADTVTQSPGQL